jgi:hypothetical protein
MIIGNGNVLHSSYQVLTKINTLYDNPVSLLTFTHMKQINAATTDYITYNTSIQIHTSYILFIGIHLTQQT